MTTWSELAIAIPTFQRNEPLLEVLRSIERQSTKPALILVVDNSPDARAQVVVRAYASGVNMMVEYLPLYANCGPAGSFAYAAAAIFARPDPPKWMMCRGDDNPFETNYAISSIQGFADKVADMSPAAIGTHGERYDFKKAQLRRVAGRELLSHDVVSVDCIPGSGTPTYHLPSLNNARIGFDPHLFFGYEELDIGLRLRRAGKLLLVDSLADINFRKSIGIMEIADHISVYNLRRSNWRLYFSHRNSLLIARKHSSIYGIISNIMRASRAVLGALVKRRSLAEAAARIAGTFDGMKKNVPARSRYIPLSSLDVSINPDNPYRKYLNDKIL